MSANSAKHKYLNNPLDAAATNEAALLSPAPQSRRAEAGQPSVELVERNGSGADAENAGPAGKHTDVVNLGDLTKSEGLTLSGIAGTGWSVSAAGDINGDGYADVLVGSVLQHHENGAAYILFGGKDGLNAASGQEEIKIAKIHGDGGFGVGTNAYFGHTGFSVSAAGDINGDGLDDLLVSAPHSRRSAPVYVIFGNEDMINQPSNAIGFMPAAYGFTITDTAAGGLSLASAGDVNGDGFDDIIVNGNLTSRYDGASQAYVIFGTDQGHGTVPSGDAYGRASLDLSTLSADQGFIIKSSTADEGVGFSISSAGDVNGDGFADLIVGSAMAAGSDGKAYVIFGSASGFGTSDGQGHQVIDVGTLTPDQGFVIRTNAAGAVSQNTVSSAGDVNGDGVDDLMVSTAFSGDNAPDRRTYVLFGTKDGFGTDISGQQVIDLTAKLPGKEGFIIQGQGFGNGSADSRSVASAGDINGDGYDDLIIGTPGSAATKHAGGADVIFGTDKGFGTVTGGQRVVDLKSLSASGGFAIHGVFGGDRAGFSVSSAGDVNRDGFDDLIIGAPHLSSTPQARDPMGKVSPQANEGGDAYILFGGTLGDHRTPVKMVGSAANEILIGHAGDDVLNGRGGHDIFRSGAGNDTIRIADANVASIDAGNGRSDLVQLTGAGIDFDCRDFSVNQLTGIEAFDLTGKGDNSLTIAASDIFHFSTVGNKDFTAAQSNNNLVVYGNAGDTLDLIDYTSSDAHWALAVFDRGLDGSKHGNFDFYTLVSSTDSPLHDGPLAEIAVNHNVSVAL